MSDTSHAPSYHQRCLCQRWCCRLIVLCAVFALTSCTMAGGDSLPTPNTVQPTATGTILPFTTIAQGDQLSANLVVDKPEIIVIASAREIDAALRQAASDHAQLAMAQNLVNQIRQIDYDRSFAILVLQGKQGSSGYSVTVQRLVRQDDIVSVTATFVSPGFGQGVRDEGTDPYHLVTVSKVDKWGQNVRFELVDKGQVVAETTHLIE